LNECDALVCTDRGIFFIFNGKRLAVSISACQPFFQNKEMSIGRVKHVSSSSKFCPANQHFSQTHEADRQNACRINSIQYGILEFPT